MILLAGATSSPGRLVAETLLKNRHRVRVLVRSERDPTAFANQGADVVRGDGHACDPSPARELLGREPTPVRGYYATTTQTPWAEADFGALRNRA